MNVIYLWKINILEFKLLKQGWRELMKVIV